MTEFKLAVQKCIGWIQVGSAEVRWLDSSWQTEKPPSSLGLKAGALRFKAPAC